MTCPKCNKEMVWVSTLIEHNGIEHPGPETWFCMFCNYGEPIKLPEFKTTFNESQGVIIHDPNQRS